MLQTGKELKLRQLAPIQKELTYRTTDPFEANFGEFRDTLFLANVCLEQKISYKILPESTLIPHPYFDFTVFKDSRFIMSHL